MKGILIDTCIWIDYFRKTTNNTAQTVEQILLNERVFICGPILYEIIRGIKTSKEKDAFIEAIKAVNHIEMTRELWFKAGELSLELKNSGKIIPFSDMIIATIALQNNLSVFTYDTHFQLIPGLELYASSPVIRNS
jgi:predicted nucleic acid-binding protein